MGNLEEGLECAQLLKCVDAHLMPIKHIQFNAPLPSHMYANGDMAAQNMSERTLMLTSSRDKTCKLWELQEYGLLKTYRANRPLNDGAISPLFTMNGGVATSGGGGNSNTKDKTKDQQVATPTQPRYHIICGGGVEARDVTTSTEGGFESVFFHMVSEEELCQVKGHFGPMNAIAISPDGKSYVTGGEDGLLRLIHFDNAYFSNKEL